MPLPSASLESIVTPAHIPNSTPTIIPLKFTSTPIPFPAPTAYPEISEINPKQFVTELLQNNGSCKLPCLLGIPLESTSRPNVTDLMQFFSRLDRHLDDPSAGFSVEQKNRGDWSGSLMQFWEDGTYVNVELYFYFDGKSLSQGILRSGAYQSGSDSTQILYENPYYSQLIRNFSIVNILSLYGEPDQLLIAPFPDDSEHPEATYTFSFVLFYPEQGFLIQYVSLREKVGENFIGCPQKSVIDISTWNPRMKMSLENAVQHFDSIDSINKLNWDYFKPIEEVTNYDVGYFYNTFKTGTDTCIESSSRLWPSLEP